MCRSCRCGRSRQGGIPYPEPPSFPQTLSACLLWYGVPTRPVRGRPWCCGFRSRKSRRRWGALSPQRAEHAEGGVCEVLGPVPRSACPLLTRCGRYVRPDRLRGPSVPQFLHPQNGERIPHLPQMVVVCNTQREPHCKLWTWGDLLRQQRSVD